MTITSKLHDEAMSLAEDAWVKRHEGDFVAYRKAIRVAYEKERAAAESVAGEVDFEPTRSVLLRSAASLALECGETREAERLVSIALTGNPPNEIAEELRDINEQVGLQRHLDTRGIVLHPNQVQVALVGNAVGFGVAESGVFLERVRGLESLIFRTAERRAKRPFRERGRRAGQLAREVELFVVAPRPGSFTVSLQLGRHAQLGLEGFGFAEEVIQEFLDCMQLFQVGDKKKLEEQIADEAYLANFVALARNISPDGDSIRSVAFSAGGRFRGREVLLTRPRHEAIAVPPSVRLVPPVENVAIQGVLKFADAMKENENEIGLVDATSHRYRVFVPPGLMDDIVRPLWDCEVYVLGSKRGNAIYLTEIQPVPALPPPSEGKDPNK